LIQTFNEEVLTAKGFCEDVLNGLYFDGVDSMDLIAYYSDYFPIYKHYLKYEYLKETEFSEMEVDVILDKIESRIFSLLSFQAAINELKIIISEYESVGGELAENDVRLEIVRSEKFSSYLNSFAKLFYSDWFCGDGFRILEKMHVYLDKLYAREGQIKIPGRGILTDAEGYLLNFLAKISMNPAISDDIVSEISGWHDVIKKLRENAWNYTAEDVEALTSAYKYFNNDAVFVDIGDYKNTIGSKIEEVVRKFRDPNVGENVTALTDEDKDIINAVREVVRSAYGAEGRIKKVDLKYLNSLKDRIRNLLLQKGEGLMSVEEYKLFNNVLDDLNLLLDSNKLSINWDIDAVIIMRRMAELRSSRAKELLDNALKNFLVSSFEVSRAKTMMLGTNINSADVSKYLDSLRKSGTNSDSVDFDFSGDFSEQLTFFRKIEELRSRGISKNLLIEAKTLFSKLLSLQNLDLQSEFSDFLGKYETVGMPDFNELEKYLTTSISRMSLILIVHDLDKSESEDIEGAHLKYLELMAKVRQAVWHYVLSYTVYFAMTTKGSLSYTIQGFMDNQFDLYLGDFEKLSEFDNFIAEVRVINVMRTINGLVSKNPRLSNMNFSDSFLDRVDKFLDSLMKFAYDDYQLEAIDVNRVKCAIDFCLDLKEKFPRNEKSVLPGHIYYSALENLKKENFGSF